LSIGLTVTSGRTISPGLATLGTVVGFEILSQACGVNEIERVTRTVFHLCKQVTQITAEWGFEFTSSVASFKQDHNRGVSCVSHSESWNMPALRA
jgi:hypothetical protein